MKKRFFYFLVLVSVFSVFTSCKDKEDEEETPVSKVSAMVDGKFWASSQSTATYRNGILVMTLKAADGSKIVMRTKLEVNYEEWAAPYSYVSGSTTQYATYQASATGPVFTTSANSNNYMNSITDVYPSALYIDKFDKSNNLLSGSFSLELKDPSGLGMVTITKGTFIDVLYDTSAPVLPAKTVSATVDGVAFVGTVNSVSSYSYITTTFTASSGKSIVLEVPSSIVPGTYPISTYSNYNLDYYNGTYTSTASAGSLVITEHDIDLKVLKGTFTASAATTGYSQPFTYSITGGSFVTTY